MDSKKTEASNPSAGNTLLAFSAKQILWMALSAALFIAMLYIAFSPEKLKNQQTTQNAVPSTTQTRGSALLPRKPSGTPAKIVFGPLTRQHLSQFEEWIKQVPRNHYFIQLLSADARHTGEVEGFLAKANEVLDPTEIRVYRSNLSGRDRVGVIYGSYPTREEAAAVMLALPESIKAAQPFPRQVSRLF